MNNTYTVSHLQLCERPLRPTQPAFVVKTLTNIRRRNIVQVCHFRYQLFAVAVSCVNNEEMVLN